MSFTEYNRDEYIAELQQLLDDDPTNQALKDDLDDLGVFDEC